METPFAHTNVPIAIVGMACRLPGADNLEQFWQLLASGGSAVVELPKDRLDQQLYYDPRRGQRGKSYSKLGAIISSRQFNSAACPIPKQLERGVDNAHLLMCETAAQALRHAGMDPFRLPLRNAGVYIGHAQGSNLAGELTFGTCIEEAAQFLREVPGFKQLPPAEQEAVVSNLVETIRGEMPKRTADAPDAAINMVAGTISKAFGLNGPFIAVNSACASSLQAVLFGVRALQMGRIDMAIVGGASDCKTDSLVLFSHAQSMSETGSRPFDSNADGLICSEGYVALVLKTLDRALADGDPIQAVIRGLGMSSDGRGKSLWAPRKEGQVKAMERAYRHGLDMASLQYIEAHATSTNLGDATELNALSEVLSGKFTSGKKIPITSVKANIGHALEAAGLSSVIKTVLCMQHRTFVPAINIKTLNPKIQWEKAPYYIPTRAETWPEQADGSPRRAAVNAFGIGGLNLHIVLEEHTRGAPAAPLPRRKPDDDAIAVIGMGCIMPGASQPTKFWELISTGRDPKCETPTGRWRTDLSLEPGSRRPYRTPTTLGGYITDFAYDWRKHKEPPKQVQQADPLQFMLLEAADQALIDSGYDKKPFDRTRVGVMVGTEFGGDFSTQLELGLRLPYLESILKRSLAGRGIGADAAAGIAGSFSEVLLKHWPALVDESGSFSTSTLASRITKTMNLMGGAAAVDSGDASAAAALSVSVDILLSGDCDMMICASGQRCMSLPQFEGMAVNGVLAEGPNPPAPFDASAHGIVPGEGVGVLLLKRLSDARRDGDRVHTIIRGIGASHAGAAEEAMRLAIERAFATSPFHPADVAVIELDGTGLPHSDQEQLRAVLSAYGAQQRPEPILLSSVTGQIGHTVGGSAMASLLKASLEIENGQMPAVFGLRTPLPIVQENPSMLRTPTAPMPIRHTSGDGRRVAAVSSYGKGLAYHILLERGEKVPVAPAVAQSQPVQKTIATPAPAVPAAPLAVSRICRLGAATQAELGAQIDRALSNPASAFTAAQASSFAAEHKLRLAVVADSPDALARKLQSAAKQLGNPSAQPVLEQQGCFFRQLPVTRPRVAFLFAGQGSQYAGMLRDLVRDVPAAADRMRQIDAVMVQRGYQSFAQMAWENTGQLGTDIWVTQISMLLADLIMYAAVSDLGVPVDLVAGHSYGEFAALTAAGVWDLEGVVTAARARYDAIQAVPGARGTLLATTAEPAIIEQALTSLPHAAYIANYNAPDQTVVGGQSETLQQLAQLLAAHGHKSQLLSVPCPFHTPLMAGVGEILKRTLDALRLRPPRTPVLSTVTNRYVAEPEEIRQNLAAQLTTPVRYVDLINRVADEQETVFVEIGPQQALTKLNRRILEGRGVAGIVASDNPKRPGTEQLLSVRALLECLGLVDSPVQSKQANLTIAAAGGAVQKGPITHFDATQRRTERMRRAASGTPKTAAPAAERGGMYVRQHDGDGSATNGNANGNGHGPAHVKHLPERSAVPVASPVRSTTPATPRMAAPAAAPKPAAAPAAKRPEPAARSAPAETPAVAGGALNPAELEKFLINFVVEQTGYPPEVVELDADLEADLGIDSIKKAQLFGELAEYFDVQPNENMTLDDFPTLRHVLNFLSGARTKGELPGGPTAPVTAAAVAPAPAAYQAPQAVAASAPVEAQAAAGGALDPAELEKFLINFVVEQTGYPPEVVELDADLEADLGIDSIKKAQLFGELAEYFDVQPNENMTLDDFPTLRHVLNFLSGARTRGELPGGHAAPVATAAATAPAAYQAPQPVAASAPAEAPAVAGDALDPAELEKFLINFVVEQTGYPPEVVELDADLEADLGIDSIKKAQLFGELAEYFDVQPNENMTLDDFPTLRHVLNFLSGARTKGDLPGGPAAPVATAAAPAYQAPQPVTVSAPAEAPTSTACALDPAELEKFLINFVVEQTGYPPEVVELDADLEADLGIDSIKKAQLFGELAEYFDVQPNENMTLDDFPTLRHVLTFLAGSDLKKNLAPSSFDGGTDARPSRSAAIESHEPSATGSATGMLETSNGSSSTWAEKEPAVGVLDAPLAAETSLPLVQLRGTPYQMGLEHGRQLRTVIRRVLRRYADLAGSEALDHSQTASTMPELEAQFSSDELQEVRGIAEGAGVPRANILALNLAVFADFGMAARHMVAPDAKNGSGGYLHAASYELPLAGALCECLQTVVQLRSPEAGAAHTVVSLAGAVGGVCGVNSHGVAISMGAAGASGGHAGHARRHATATLDVLTHASSLDSAIGRLQTHTLGAVCETLLSDRSTGRSCRVAANGQRIDAHQDAAPSAMTFAAARAFLAADDSAATDRPRVEAIFASCTGEFWVTAPGLNACHGATTERYDLTKVLSLAPQAALATPGILEGPPYDLDDSQARAAQRFAMTPVEVPFDPSAPEMPQWQGAALLVGNNVLSEALGNRLRAAGVVVRELPISNDLDETLAAFDAIWSEQPTPHVFILTGREPRVDLTDEAAWQRRWYRVAILPYFLSQRWVERAAQANLLDRATLIGATALGGDFGFSGEIASPECAALNGLMKAIYIEIAIMRNLRDMRAKAVDAPDDESPELLAANICRELASKAIDFEVSFAAGSRLLGYAFPEAAQPREQTDIRPGGVWVMTGGARGITAECALELGRRFGLKLHVIGTTMPREIDPLWRDLSAEGLKSLKATVMREARSAGKSMDDEWARVQKEIEIDRVRRAFAQAHVEATYHACDVADGRSLAAVLEAIRRQDGPIEGIVHGAGIERSGSFERKSREVVLATLGAKVEGALNLMRLTRHDPIRHFIGFGSISGRMGSNGQTDYCLASDVLCKLTAWYRRFRPGVHAVGFHWHPWDEVGMAARPESATMLKLADGPARMSKREGVEHLLRELYAGAPRHEVLITTWEYHGRFYGTQDHPQNRESNSAAAKPTNWEPLSFEPLTARHELRMVAAPLVPEPKALARLEGPVAIWGQNAAALALRDRLAASGVSVHVLPYTTSAKDAIAAIEALYAAAPIRYLFLMSARDEVKQPLLDRAGWQERRALGIQVPFEVAHHWFRLRIKARDKSPVTVVAATALGGDFGLSGHVSQCDGGALCGWLKSLYVEDSRKTPREVRVKVVDLPASEPADSVVDAILKELSADDPHVEVGWSGGMRSVPRSVAVPVESLAKGEVRRGGTWVVTGGARGITAAAALEMGKRFGLKLHLVGRSPAPEAGAAWRGATGDRLAQIKAQVVRQAVSEGRSPERDWEKIKIDIEIDETLRKFADAGIAVRYHACDLSDWDQLGRILDEIRQVDGPIEGIVHGAGYANSGRFGTRHPDYLERTLAGKLDGAAGLMALTRHDPVRYFLAFGSIGGRFGANGLSDYAAANDMLAKLCDWYRASNPSRAVCCMHWQSWDEIGMAMLGDSAVGTKGILKMAFIPPREGVEHLCRELEAGLPTNEVVITDGFFEKTFYPFAVPTQPSADSMDIARLPMVERMTDDGHSQRAEIELEPETDPFLIDHQLRGRPILPAVVGLEAMVEAAVVVGGGSVVAVRDLELVEGLLFRTSRKVAASVKVARRPDGTLGCELLSDFCNQAGKLIKKDRLHARVIVEVGERKPLELTMSQPAGPLEKFFFANSEAMMHGPTLQGLEAIGCDATGGWAQLRALPLRNLGGARRGGDWLVPATILDAAFYACGVHTWVHVDQVVALPSALALARFGRMPRENEPCMVDFHCRGVEGRNAVYDFTVFGEDRAPLLAVEGYRIVMIK